MNGPHNIIIFGETGCGKSSVVNMLVGSAVAKVSKDAAGCTFQNDLYRFDIGGTYFRIFDTAGLDNGEEGQVPHAKAVQGLYTLIRQVDGISLVVLCIRGRVRSNTRANYHLFSKVICGEMVPTIVVVTGLENEANLDDWWGRGENKEVFKRYGMEPRGVRCVVSVRGDHNQYADMYRESQEKLRELILSTLRRDPWTRKDKEAWFSQWHVYTRATILDRRKEFSAEMVTILDKFAKEVNMGKEDTKRLKRNLLEAEKEMGREKKRGLMYDAIF